MHIHITLKHTSRELDLEIPATQDEVIEELLAADRNGKALTFTDDKGRKVYVPHGSVAAVEIGETTPRRVGFGV